MEVDEGPVTNHEGIKQYYSSKIESLQVHSIGLMNLKLTGCNCRAGKVYMS